MNKRTTRKTARDKINVVLPEYEQSSLPFFTLLEAGVELWATLELGLVEDKENLKKRLQGALVTYGVLLVGVNCTEEQFKEIQTEEAAAEFAAMTAKMDADLGFDKPKPKSKKAAARKGGAK